MKNKREPSYTIKAFFKDHKKLLGGKAITDYSLFRGFVSDFFYALNIEIIRNSYEWKIGSRGGYLRIAKSKTGSFFWLWDKKTDYAVIPKRFLWDFKPAVGWQKPVEIGERGLNKWIIECKLDPFKPKYDVIERLRHRTR